MPSEIILDGVVYLLVPKSGTKAAEPFAAEGMFVEARMKDPTPWTVDEVASAAGKAAKTIRKEVARKRLRPAGKTKPYRFMGKEVARYLEGGAA